METYLPLSKCSGYLNLNFVKHVNRDVTDRDTYLKGRKVRS
jgi:hypothetical protein